jgi:hypothetical protein
MFDSQLSEFNNLKFSKGLALSPGLALNVMMKVQ